MKIGDNTIKRVLLLLLKDFSVIHTITSLAHELHLSRVGSWKVVKKLEDNQLVTVRSAGSGKTNTFLVKLNLDNVLVEKSLSLYLTEESFSQKRWKSNFAELEEAVNFLILYGSILRFPQDAEDIDLVGVISQKKNFVKIQQIIDSVQKTQSKKIHIINFTEAEFTEELLKPNKAFIEAAKKGIILFGQENFIQFMRKIHPK